MVVNMGNDQLYNTTKKNWKMSLVSYLSTEILYHMRIHRGYRANKVYIYDIIFKIRIIIGTIITKSTSIGTVVSTV